MRPPSYTSRRTLLNRFVGFATWGLATGGLGSVLPSRGVSADWSLPEPVQAAGALNGDTLRLASGDEVRLIGIKGEPIGVVSLAQANAMAEELEIDLVEIAPTAQPPVARLMDFGKFKYSEAKRKHEAKLKQKQIQVKEVKFRPGTDDGDYQIKLRNLTRFLTEGDKTKITLRFRGREMAHPELGMKLLQQVKADFDEVAKVEYEPRMEGRQMIMILAPR